MMTRFPLFHQTQDTTDETWKSFPTLACGDYDFRDSDVLSIRYPVYLIGNNLTMEGIGSFLADQFDAHYPQRYDRIVIVAHSIGGLLARRFVLERRPSAKVVLLVEIGTPHLGPYSYTKIADYILLKGGRLVGEIQAGSPFLQKLSTDWVGIPRDRRPHTYCTGSPKDYVVSLPSAQDSCDEKHAYPQFDHRELVKPTSIEDDRYKIPMQTVKQYLEQS